MRNIPEKTRARAKPRHRGPFPPGWNVENDYPPWLPSAPWMAEEGPEEVPKDGEHWERARKLVEDYDAGTIAGWKDEVQTQLLVVRLLWFLSGCSY